MVRIALHAAKVDFEDKHIDFPAYMESKATATDPAWINGLPVLEIDGVSYSQSIAQLRYAGKLAKLYPEDPVAALSVDEAMDVCQDALTKCPQDADVEVKKAKREEYAAGKLKTLMAVLNKKVESSGSGFIAGSALSIADLCVYGLLSMIRSGMFDHVPSDYVDQWPKLAALEPAVKEHPIVKAYYASKA